MGLTFKENLVTKGSEMGFDYGRCDRKLLYAAYKDWTGMGGTKFPLKHNAFAKRLCIRGVGDGRKEDRSGRCADWTPHSGVLTIFSFAYRVGRIDSGE